MTGFQGEAGIVERLHDARPGDFLLVREGTQGARRYSVISVRGDRAREVSVRGMAGAKRTLVDCLDHVMLVRGLEGGKSEGRRVTELEFAGRMPERVEAGTGSLKVADMTLHVVGKSKPISADALAWLLRCTTVEDLAEWIIDNGDGIDVVTAMRVLLMARELTNAKP